MDEAQALNLAVDAYTALQGIREDVAHIKGVDSDILALLSERSEVPAPQDAEVQLYALDDEPPTSGEWVTEVRSETEMPASFFTDVMAFQYMQTIVMVMLLLALLLNLGANLWLAFSDKWRA